MSLLKFIPNRSKRMKDYNKLIKLFLLLGGIGFGIGCIWSGYVGSQMFNSWPAIIFITFIYICFSIAGILYTQKTHIRKTKRCYIIKVVIFFYAIVIIGIIMNKLFPFVKIN